MSGHLLKAWRLLPRQLKWLAAIALAFSALLTVVTWWNAAALRTAPSALATTLPPWSPVLLGLTLTITLAALVWTLTRRERALRNAMTRTELGLAASGTGVWAVDLTTGAVDLDQRAAQILGLAPRRQASRWDIEQCVVPEDRARGQAAVENAMSAAGSGMYDGEFRIVRPGGSEVRWVVVRGQVEHTGGAAAHIYGTIRDITDKKSAERDLAQTRERLAGIVDQANDAIISIDAAQRITLFNRGAEAMFGFKLEEVVGAPLDLLLPKHVHTAHRRHIEGFGAGEVTSRRMAERAEIFGLRKSGEQFPAEASISRIDTSQGAVFTAIVRDISERRRYQAELEQRVSERTQALHEEIRRREGAQAALVQAQRMDALGQLTGGVAHDSNNLLAVITGNLELIEDELDLQHPARKYLQQAQEAARMGARLNQRLLTFSRRRRLEPQVICLNDQVLAMNDLLRRALGEHIEFTTTLAPDLWRTKADPSEVENAILNLALNARDAMPGGGQLRIETSNALIEPEMARYEEGLAPGAYVRLAVSDKGAGMTPDVLRRVFEPFFTTKETGKGSGLGLSTIFGFAKQSKGHVTIYSEVGHGTTVNLYLPRVSAGEDTLEPAAQATPVARGHGERILVVEDNAQVRALALERLQRLGYRTIEADSGPAALAIVDAETDIDLVFSDVVMPGGMSGFELSRAVKEARADLPVLLTSGFSFDAAGSEGGGPGALPVLRKPYTTAELASAVSRALGG
ncbi:MAG: PAS domain S-box protein [Hyphomicrobiales bacterium]|nr:PAS domain S-box protein [Hyphomicrobiales bacterium]